MIAVPMNFCEVNMKKYITILIICFLISSCTIVTTAVKRNNAESKIRTDGYYLISGMKISFFENDKGDLNRFISDKPYKGYKATGAFYVHFNYHKPDERGKFCMLFIHEASTGTVSSCFIMDDKGNIPFRFVPFKPLIAPSKHPLEDG